MSTALFTTTAGMSWLLSISVDAAVLLAASWLGAALLRRSPAGARHQIWTLGVLGALVLPLMCWTVPSLSSWLSSNTPTIANGGTLEASAVVVMPGAATDVAPTWPLWVAIVWAMGTLVVAFRFVLGHLAAHQLMRGAEPDVAASWTEALREAAAALAVTKHIRLFRSASIGSPMTIGVLRPRVLLPAAADAWTTERLRAVLVHELGHVRRHDTAIQVAAQLACALYWWNPLAWLAAARLRLEREHACDDLVLGAGIRPSSYAADLLDVARSISMDAHAGVGAVCMADRSWTEARLHRILDARTPRRPLRTRFRVAMYALALAGAVTLACTSSPPKLSEGRATTTQGTLSLGPPSVREWTMLQPVHRGALDLSLVTTEVKRRLGDLEACYQRRLAVDPALAGTVVIHWVIDESGKVPDACITTDTVGDHALTACVNKLVLEGGNFPAPRGGSVDVTFPFVFTASKT